MWHTDLCVKALDLFDQGHKFECREIVDTMGSGGHGQGHAGSEGGLRIVQKQLSTAPSSPTHPTEPARHVTEPDEQSTTYTTYSIPPKHATAGTFSFGPATRRTVTTVTTTTTVSLPPLVIKPPLNLHERDARQYPLAFVPTPSHLRKFVTSVNGADVTFEEGEDAAVVVQKHSDLLSAIGRGHGVLEEEEAGPSIRTMSNSATQALHSVGVPRAPKRANPPSIAEAAELAGLQRRIKKPRSRLYKALDHPRDDLQRQNTASTRTITQAQNRSPLTPNEDVSAQRDSASSTFDSEQMPQGGLWAAVANKPTAWKWKSTPTSRTAHYKVPMRKASSYSEVGERRRPPRQRPHG